jgi:hypothetical protein
MYEAAVAEEVDEVPDQGFLTEESGLAKVVIKEQKKIKIKEIKGEYLALSHPDNEWYNGV